MRLKNIKLAGFKSFVDPTNVSFPSSLVAVVGPNGCGKSNIIDAVRWVMGESSAKNLRGESMIDVIFNGASQRKPVGQASVELIFENDAGRLVGEFASYREISIKRIVTRDSHSTYYLNGAKCRRKDVTDIFLGTGLGPRSYSIIGQGTVSRIIEAKPEELRIFLEEAAGISKYKERRRETENRIRHTKDNLLRVTDLREELGKQLDRLKRQASAAERYKTLKSEERLYKAQLLGLRWIMLNDELSQVDKGICENTLKLEKLLMEHNRIDITIDELRSAYESANDALNTAQGEFYRIGADITRLEESLKNQRERQKELDADLSQVKQDWQQATDHLGKNQQSALVVEQAIIKLDPQRATLKESYMISEALLESFETQKEEWQEKWDDFIEGSAESSKIAHVEQSKIQQFELMINKIELKLSKLQEEKERLTVLPLENELTALNNELEQMNAQYEETNSQLEVLNESYKSKRLEFETLENDFHQTRSLLSQDKAKEASLLQLQKAALGSENEKSNQWLKEHQLQTVKRLAQVIEVEERFDRALEIVLGDALQALCVNEISALEVALNEIKKDALIFVEPNVKLTASVSANFPALYNKVKTSHAVCQNLLSGIYVAKDLSEALSWLSHIADNESIVINDGILLGKGWCRVMREHDPQSGVIAREKVILALQEKIANDIDRSDEQKHVLTALRNSIEQLELEREKAQKQLNERYGVLMDSRSTLQVTTNKIEQIERRLAGIDLEYLSETQQKESALEALDTSRDSWTDAMQAMDADALRREELTQSQKILNETLSQHRQESADHRHALYELELTLKTKQSELIGIKSAIVRESTQTEGLKIRIETLLVAYEKNKVKEASSNQQVLDSTLMAQCEAEELLNKEKLALENIKFILSNTETEKLTYSGAISSEKLAIDEQRINRQTLIVKRESIEESFLEDNHQIKPLIENMPKEASISTWNEEVKTIAIKIGRLGAINLAAIDEYDIESKRKLYLDEQYEDLAKALDTLETAIHKIDRETRTRFRDTFEQVNTGFKKLFPRLFGGGEAQLSLTGEDLLNTGVTVMARPPGKRNSTIHLLSGGEKALTAVALIFAIFQLNPSPFCMLDEVDAPLDDTNVNRFCALVKDMAKQVQFIFISHNKVAMEMAQQLLGVTMLEPGVSRIVSVDMEEAMAIAT